MPNKPCHPTGISLPVPSQPLIHPRPRMHIERYPMKYLAVAFVLVVVGCKQRTVEEAIPGRAVFDQFHSILLEGDFHKLAHRLAPEVLMEFRKYLEFTVSQPMEGSWFTGSRDRRATKEELSAVSDAEFFTRYMNGTSEISGNPFKQRYTSGNLIDGTIEDERFCRFTYALGGSNGSKVKFNFNKVDGDWLLVEPSITTIFAEQVRSANGRTIEG